MKSDFTHSIPLRNLDNFFVKEQQHKGTVSGDSDVCRKYTRGGGGVVSITQEKLTL